MQPNAKRFVSPFLILLALAAIVLVGLNVASPAMAGDPSEDGNAGTSVQRQPGESEPTYRSSEIIDVGPAIRNKRLPLDLAGAAELAQAAGPLAGTYGVGDERVFLYLDDYQGRYRATTYEVRLISDTVEVWVQADLQYYNLDGTVNPIHPDARDPEYITQERIEALAAVAEDMIIPTDVEYFGDYDSLDGSQALLPSLLGLPDDYYTTDNGKRVIVLVSNVRDANFYDPVNNASFIAGFYSPTYELYADRNIITIDSKQWNRRVGAPSFDYDATIGHEFQHLINDDYDADEESWANEGRSEFAEFILGYRPDPEAHRTQWSDYPENSLTLWGDQDGDPDQTFEILADYQQAYWFMLYLAGRLQEAGIHTANGQYLKDVSRLTTDPANGAGSIDAMLEDVGASFRFRELWEDFRAEMLYGGSSDATGWGDYISQYSPPSGVPIAPLDLGRMRRNLTFEGYDTPGAPADGSDYVEIGWSPAITAGTALSFDGDNSPAPTDWTVVAADSTGVAPSGSVSGNVLYSGHTDLSDNFLIFETTVPTDGSQALAFDTLYNIEETWDFGFVQVTTDTAGATGFTSLEITGMITETDPSAHPIIAANVPGFSGLSGAGETVGWVHVTADLSAYAGETILLAFRYATDWASGGNGVDAPEAGWYLDNVKVGATWLYRDQATVPTGAASIWEARGKRNEFRLDVVTFADKNGVDVEQIITTPLDVNADGTFVLGSLLGDASFDEAGERVVALVSAIPPTLDADLISIPTSYGPYKLTGLPPSVYTSRARAIGTANGSSTRRPTVYPGDNITVTVTVDNLGRNDDLEAAPVQAYVAVPIPDNTTFVTGSLDVDVAPENIVYTPNLQSLDSGLPAEPGVYWHGTVTRTADLSFAIEVAEPLTVGTAISPTAYIANAPFGASLSQSFSSLETPVQVVSPLELSGTEIPEPVIGGQSATLGYTLLNTDDATRSVDFRFVTPPGTTFEGVRVNRVDLTGAASAQETGLTLNLDVPSYLESGEVVVVEVTLGVPPEFAGQSFTAPAWIYQPGSDTADLTLTPQAVTVLYGSYLPFVSYTAP